MATSKPKPKAVPIRLPAEMVARVDKLRDPLVPREPFVRDLLDKALTARERKVNARK